MTHSLWGRFVGAVLVGGAVLAGIAMPVDAANNAEGKKTRVTIDVKDTDVGRVLDAFSQQTGLSVVVGNEVKGQVSVRLMDVEWDRALDAILKPYGFGYERSGDVIIVLPLAKLQ